MRRLTYATLALLVLSVHGCSCSGSDTTGADSGFDGRIDGSLADASLGIDSEAGAAVDAGGDAAGCVPVACQGHTYACGDCIDNDMDGRSDSADPDCVGPCDNNESGFFLNIPGGGAAPCRLDCYFDQDTGSGNDRCEWDVRCDPLSTDPACPYTDPPPRSAQCPVPQQDECLEFCLPLVPNGCDCFGCCELPAESGRFVFLGSDDDDGGTCTLEDLGDPEACHPCTPVRDCYEECGRCELCLGRTELPADCFPPPDGGVPPPGDRCEAGEQECGLIGDPPCPEMQYCVTGCCIYFA